MQPKKILDYINMKIAKQQSPDTIDQVLDTAQVVLRWWMTQPGGDHGSLPKGIAWVQNLSKQVGDSTCPNSMSVCDCPPQLSPMFHAGGQVFAPSKAFCG